MKTISKRLLCILLSVFLLLAALPLTVSAATVYQVGTSQEIQDAAAAINNAGAGEYVIELTADITSDTSGISFDNPGAVVTIVGNGHSYTCPLGQNVQAWNGATVNLGDGSTDLTLIGGVNNDYPGLVYVNGNASTCNMYDKVTLRDNEGQNYFGGGVTVQSGTFHMYGGTIQNCGINGGSVCYGGGVAVFADGNFIMDGGVITECYANSDYIDDYDPNRCFTAMGGGVFVTAGSNFTMNGGTISNCEATNFGGGVAMVMSDTYNSRPSEWRTYGMGNPKSNVTINGGTITGNEADCGAGVFASGYFYAFAGAFGWTLPTGVSVNPGLFINGGEISSNEAAGMGGGVLVAMLRPAAKVQIHNAEIKNNTADNGAGIENFGYWTQMDIDGCTITGNSAVTNGGGILLTTNSSNGYTNLKNSTVTGNTSGEIGAGVYYDASSRLNISGADVIQNNTYNGKLNNLNVLSLSKPVYVNGALTGSQIGLSDPTLWDDGLEDTAPDAASADHLTSGYRTYNPDEHPNEYFTSDHETWYVDRSAKTTTTVDDPNSNPYREYTVRRYPVVTPNTKAYAGHLNQYVISDIQNPDLQNSAPLNLDQIISEIRFRFENSNYTIGTNVNSNGNVYIKYNPVDTDSALASVTLQKSSYNNYLTLTYSAKQPRGGTIQYTATASDQSSYANTGELVLKITSNGDTTLSNYAFSENYTTDTVNYVNADPPGNVLYEYDVNGDVAAKLEIVSSETKTVQITTESGTDDEVRLNRKETVDYHINNEDISSSDVYQGVDEFTEYVNDLAHTVSIGDTIEAFYLIPQHDTEYIFKGWYYDPENDDDDRPVQFGTDKYIKGKDIYAHWIKVEDVEKDEEDENSFTAEGVTKYGGFDLAGVQIRKKVVDSNFDYAWKPGGMRFVTSLSTDVVEQINAIRPNNIEYGYVAATNEGWIGYHQNNAHKLQYISKTANGIDTSDTAAADNYFDFATNVNCTSRKMCSKGVVYEDHRNYDGYLLYTLVITYENVDDSGYDKDVLARPYIHYTDANGLERVAYSEYRGSSNTIGGCYTSYNDVA